MLIFFYFFFPDQYLVYKIETVIEIIARRRNTKMRNPMSILDKSTKISFMPETTNAAMASHRYFILWIKRLMRKNNMAAKIHETVMYDDGNAW